MIDWDRVNALRDEVGPEAFAEVVELFLEEVDEKVVPLTHAARDGIDAAAFEPAFGGDRFAA